MVGSIGRSEVEVCMTVFGKVTNGEWLAYEERRTETKKYGSDQILVMIFTETIASFENI